MKLAIIGAGLQAKAICHVLALQDDVTSVVVADIDVAKAQELVEALGDRRFCAAHCDAFKFEEVRKLFLGVDAAIGAASYKVNYIASVAAVEASCSYCDLGGNNDIVERQLSEHRKAEVMGAAIVPDCGLAPGLASILTAHAVKEMGTVDSVQIRCGGLPQERDGVLDYALVFSVEGLINEYVEDVTVLRDGEIKIVPSLDELETLTFPAPFGELEAFTTSGGISTLPQTYQGGSMNLDYKTIRYPGHGRIFRALKDLGMLEGSPRAILEEQLRRNLRKDVADVILLRVTAVNTTETRVYQVIDYPADDLSAMERMTGFPAALVLLALGRGEIAPGARPQELCVDSESILKGLKELGVDIGLSTQLIT